MVNSLAGHGYDLLYLGADNINSSRDLNCPIRRIEETMINNGLEISEALHDDIESVIMKYSDMDVPVSIVIGVLEIIKHEMLISDDDDA